ncbi:protein kinase, partial [bacterium]
MIGTTVSHYRILEKLGEGGMGVVYKAQDLKLDRPVALKFLPALFTRDIEAMERFVLEAQTASTLQHNNICTIHEIDQADDLHFIAMDFYEGETLARKIARGALKTEEILDIGVQMGQGLAKAHSLGIVHRDLKPANVLITADGVVKILDFGLAKLSGRASLTRSGSTVGTVAYMSPEQIQGGEASHLSDLWSLGVVLYEMAAGAGPFRGEHEAAIMYEILNADPSPLRAVRNDIPEPLEEIIARLLQKDPSRRIASAAALAAELRAVSAAPRPAASARSIAVLYFENMSNDKENDYFCAGITDDIITDLSKIAGLNVASRTDILPFRNKLVNTREVGAALGVGYILEGSVRKAGNRIRITAQLIEVRTGFHVWADRFDRLMEDIFDLQFEVS